MTSEVFFAAMVVCGVYSVCEIVSHFTKYKIPTLIIMMAVFVIFGGELGIIPEDIMETAGFSPFIYSFGLPFVLAGFGSTMSIKSIKGESKTVVIAIITVLCILILGIIAGFIFMDEKTAIYGAVEVAGGGQAGLIFLTHLQDLGGHESLVALMLCLMNLQLLIGYPLSSFSMMKSMKTRISENNIPELATVASEDTIEKKLIKIPEWLINNFYYVFAMLGLICFLSAKISAITGLSQYLWYILFGFAFAEIGIIKHNCLDEAGLSPLMFGIMFVVICQAFLTMKVSQIGDVAFNFIILMSFGVIGCIISGIITSKLFKTDFFEGLSIAAGCMVGYPPSQKIAGEAVQAMKAQYDISDEVAERLQAYYEPKIIISGVVSISLITGLLAGFVVSFI